MLGKVPSVHDVSQRGRAKLVIAKYDRIWKFQGMEKLFVRAFLRKASNVFEGITAYW
jgi:hypothetical protein